MSLPTTKLSPTTSTIIRCSILTNTKRIVPIIIDGIHIKTFRAHVFARLGVLWTDEAERNPVAYPILSHSCKEIQHALKIEQIEL